MSGSRVAPIDDPVVKSSSIFRNLSDLEFNAVAAFLEPRRFRKGELIFAEGAAGEEMFILVSGRVSAWAKQADGTQRWLFEIKPGEFFGEMSVIANETRSATLTAKEDADLLAFHGIDFYRIIFEHPMIGIKILSVIKTVQNGWLNQTSKSLSDLMRWGETARRRAISDELTGLYNRRFLEECARDRFEQGAVGLRSLSLMMIDLDFIHNINEVHGNSAGDMVFVSTGEVLRTVTRPGDICSRLSGDEFAVLLPDTFPAEAGKIAERVRKTLFDRKVSVPKNSACNELIEVSVSASIGIASAPVHVDNWEDLYLTADGALRRAKELGRNRVELAV